MIRLTNRLSDGTVVLRDDADGAEFVLSASQWREVQALNAAQQRAAVEAYVLTNREEWAAERGPDSDLAKNMEAGTPQVDHGGSEPSTSEGR